ncbi:MAG: hypothetical protein UX24_C0016G0004 [Candidatus Giovannonibacteria bacterium GW2011_GWB1_45_9b]|uniref:Uncharacterized protein n=3 Tax=Candidatus Giovannoniibacteriota TaxID=1752738 RepID=A0A1F5WCU4_9BACT|nr:MAG: hypothetical protein UX24_C0016G0004 [Candidatus Giovannonibacteria bacterium GW2011_GWB1_45_9b]OGF73529.1 MAG: hypothetical protein A2W57_03495 [Candidatus Giovannonibacteria bacterium RIFCSPHIGHO2_02_43_16]OGF95731.1 MAG: hypothetical protein A2Y47_02050 [Candidatus Giovannonibacteria bacterium RIFCSPLOWO2_12_43_8]
MLIVVGPEVIKDFVVGYSYARRLKAIQGKVKDKIQVAMWVSCRLSEDNENNQRLKERFISTVHDHIGVPCFDGETSNDLSDELIKENEFSAASSRIMAIYNRL